MLAQNARGESRRHVPGASPNYNRSRARKTVDGDPILERVPADQWHTFLPIAHAGYIGWENTNRTRNDCWRTHSPWEPIVARVRRAKAPPCCKE
jgi:hypothetical protein